MHDVNILLLKFLSIYIVAHCKLSVHSMYAFINSQTTINRKVFSVKNGSQRINRVRDQCKLENISQYSEIVTHFNDCQQVTYKNDLFSTMLPIWSRSISDYAKWDVSKHTFKSEHPRQQNPSFECDSVHGKFTSSYLHDDHNVLCDISCFTFGIFLL